MILQLQQLVSVQSEKATRPGVQGLIAPFAGYKVTGTNQVLAKWGLVNSSLETPTGFCGQ